MKSLGHRLLQNQEILAIILEHCGQWIASCILVSKQWREAVLDRKWRLVNDVYFLFELLGRLEGILGPHQKMTFETHLRPSDWARAGQHFRRVRQVSYDERTCKEIEEEAWQELFITRPRTANWLPNLSSLQWLVHSDNALRKIMLFIHCPIRKLTVRLPAVLSPSHWKVFCEDIVTYKPELTDLDLRIQVVEIESVEAVAYIFGALKYLQVVAFPPSHISRAALLGLSTNPDLRKIRAFSHPGEDDDDDEAIVKAPIQADALGEEPLTFPPNSFSKVDEVAIQLPLSILSKSIITPMTFSSLRKLDIQTPDLEDASALHAFNSVVSQNVPHLIELSLDISDRSMSTYERSQADPIKASALEPLLSLDLHSFEFAGDCQLDIDNNDVLIIARSWPRIRRLRLNPSFLVTFKVPRSKITLSLLDALSICCPKIEELGLYIDCSMVKETPVFTEPFSNLRRFAVGFSEAGERTDTAVFLCEMLSACKGKPALEYGGYWFKRYKDHIELQTDADATRRRKISDILEQRRKDWQYIDESLLPAMLYYTSKLWGRNLADSLRQRTSNTTLHVNGTGKIVNGNGHHHFHA